MQVLVLVWSKITQTNTLESNMCVSLVLSKYQPLQEVVFVLLLVGVTLLTPHFLFSLHLSNSTLIALNAN
jgi:hypothetical protein